MKRKSSLDIAKFIGALMILIIHTNPFGSYSTLISFGFRNVICVIAVPFFFATSGYLLTGKLKALQTVQQQNNYMKKYLKRLLMIYLFWSAVYFPFVVINWLRVGFSIGLVLEYIKDFVFEGSYLTIWFLPALLTATALFFLLRRKIGSKMTFFIGCGIYVVTLLLSSYYGVLVRISGLFHKVGQLYYAVFDSVKNGVLFGWVFVAMGGLLSDADFFARFTRKQTFLGLLISYGLLCVEVVIYKLLGEPKGVDTVASLIPMTFCAMLFALTFDMQPSALCLTLHKYSILIFLCQRIPISIIELFLNETVLATNTAVKCVTVSAAAFLISFAILKLSEKWSWMKKIY